MSGPWEKYSAPAQDGPWAKYGGSDIHDAVASPPSNPNFEIAGRSQTAQGQTPEYVSDPSRLGESAPGQYSDPSEINPTKSLLTNQPIDGVVNGILRGLPANALGMAGAAAGTPAGPLTAIGGAGAGGAAGEALRQAAVQAYAAKNGLPYTTPGAVLGNVGIQAGANALGEGVSQAVGALLPSAQAWQAKNIAGVRGPAVDMAQKDAAAVARYTGATPEMGDHLAQNARNVIQSAVSNGEAEYPALINAAKANPAYAGKTFDLSTSIGNKAIEIADKYGFIGSNRVDPGAGAAKYWDLADKVGNLKDATLDEVHQIQKQLNSEASAAFGGGNRTLGAAIGELKQTVSDYLGQNIPEIGKANKAYAAAKGIEEDASKLMGANDLVGYVRRIYNNPQNTLQKQALEKAAASVPGLSEAIGEIRNYDAGIAFSPMIRPLPQTGMGAHIAKVGEAAGLLGLGGMAAHDPVIAGAGAALGAAGAAAFSPRAALTGFQFAQSKTGKAIGEALAKGLRITPGSIAAYYQLPGAVRP